ncbi:hypothetical protein AVEN_254508-1 [Araneus ventricosus]|uniref:Uncharacterized protein n=1 Tax=Araneus ventricosus TaxID=182803 RepID=A0A4Y2RK46_ARAVE|nr:hypothetical protein AVEN_254508-1 [Araneus ventricosus]
MGDPYCRACDLQQASSETQTFLLQGRNDYRRACSRMPTSTAKPQRLHCGRNRSLGVLPARATDGLVQDADVPAARRGDSCGRVETQRRSYCQARTATTELVQNTVPANATQPPEGMLENIHPTANRSNSWRHVRDTAFPTGSETTDGVLSRDTERPYCQARGTVSAGHVAETRRRSTAEQKRLRRTCPERYRRPYCKRTTSALAYERHRQFRIVLLKATTAGLVQRMRRPTAQRILTPAACQGTQTFALPRKRLRSTDARDTDRPHQSATTPESV